MTAAAPAQPPAGNTTPSLGYGDYLRFSRLAQEKFGLHFPEKSRASLEAGVRRAFAASTCTSLDDYYQLLCSPERGALEIERLANAITVGETHFFRDEPQMKALLQHVLPAIINARRATRTLRIWSIGCSSGEEPYSIAMMLRELLPDVDDWAITILGTDINTGALARARQGLYGEWAFRETWAREWQPRFFCRQDGQYALLPAVRKMVSFASLNLATDDYPSYENNTMFLDLILCRNVTIYFDQQMVRQVIDRIYDALVHDGWLAVGYSETSLLTFQRFRARSFPDATIYQRGDQQPTPICNLEAPPAATPMGQQEWFLSPAPAANEQQSADEQASRAGERQNGPTSTAGEQQIITPPAAAEPQDRPAQEPAKDKDPLIQASWLLDHGSSEKAHQLLAPLVASQPQNAAGHALLGKACANLGRWQEAEEWCCAAIRLDTLLQEAYFTLALVLQHQSRFDEAIEMMKKVVYLDRRHIPGHFMLADLYYQAGQSRKALRSLDNAGRLLGHYADDAFIDDSGGSTAGLLRAAVSLRRQQWCAEDTKSSIRTRSGKTANRS